jgi:hypothetical protein
MGLHVKDTELSWTKCLQYDGCSPEYLTHIQHRIAHGTISLHTILALVRGHPPRPWQVSYRGYRVMGEGHIASVAPQHLPDVSLSSPDPFEERWCRSHIGS